MTERFERQPTPRWYWVAAVASVLFMAAGCFDYLVDVTKNPATLPIDRRDVIMAEPTWEIGAYAVASWVGLLGTILLLFRRRSAEPFLVVSLIASFISFLPYAIVPAIRDNITTNDFALAIAILLITTSIWSFARHSKQQGWLH
jgi:hypothetical protein